MSLEANSEVPPCSLAEHLRDEGVRAVLDDRFGCPSASGPVRRRAF
jgi:hypothetical protein